METIHRFRGQAGTRWHDSVRPVGDFLGQQPTLEARAVVESRDREVEQAWLSAILDAYTNPWHCHVEVVEGYMPPSPRPDTKPTIQARWGNYYLRRGGGSFQPWFWDVYGEEFLTVQHAWLAVAQAPAPPRLTYRNKGAPRGEES